MEEKERITRLIQKRQNRRGSVRDLDNPDVVRQYLNAHDAGLESGPAQKIKRSKAGYKMKTSMEAAKRNKARRESLVTTQDNDQFKQAVLMYQIDAVQDKLLSANVQPNLDESSSTDINPLNISGSPLAASKVVHRRSSIILGARRPSTAMGTLTIENDRSRRRSAWTNQLNDNSPKNMFNSTLSRDDDITNDFHVPVTRKKSTILGGSKRPSTAINDAVSSLAASRRASTATLDFTERNSIIGDPNTVMQRPSFASRGSIINTHALLGNKTRRPSTAIQPHVNRQQSTLRSSRVLPSIQSRLQSIDNSTLVMQGYTDNDPVNDKSNSSFNSKSISKSTKSDHSSNEISFKQQKMPSESDISATASMKSVSVTATSNAHITYGDTNDDDIPRPATRLEITSPNRLNILSLSNRNRSRRHSVLSTTSNNSKNSRNQSRRASITLTPNGKIELLHSKEQRHSLNRRFSFNTQGNLAEIPQTPLKHKQRHNQISPNLVADGVSTKQRRNSLRMMKAKKRFSRRMSNIENKYDSPSKNHRVNKETSNSSNSVSSNPDGYGSDSNTNDKHSDTITESVSRSRVLQTDNGLLIDDHDDDDFDQEVVHQDIIAERLKQLKMYADASDDDNGDHDVDHAHDGAISDYTLSSGHETRIKVDATSTAGTLPLARTRGVFRHCCNFYTKTACIVFGCLGITLFVYYLSSYLQNLAVDV